MSADGVIRVGRKGKRKFAFGDDGPPFEVDVVVAFQAWICTDDQFRDQFEDRIIPTGAMPSYNALAVSFVRELATNPATGETSEVTTAEALDFIARLREQYDEVAAFFQPKSREEPDSPDSSAVELKFSAEAS